jgi:hypothetical protein
MTRREREILERAVHTIAEQASKIRLRPRGDRDRARPLRSLHTKVLQLLRVTADLQRELGTFLDTRVPARRRESSFLSRLQSDGARAARWIYERVWGRR